MGFLGIGRNGAKKPSLSSASVAKSRGRLAATINERAEARARAKTLDERAKYEKGAENPLVPARYDVLAARDPFAQGAQKPISGRNRFDYEVTADRDGLLRDAEGRLVNTGDQRSHEGRPGRIGLADYVLTREGTIFSGKGATVQQLAGGAPYVADAGRWGVVEGRAKVLRPDPSYTYGIDLENTRQLVDELDRRGAPTHLIWHEDGINNGWVKGGKHGQGVFDPESVWRRDTFPPPEAD